MKSKPLALAALTIVFALSCTEVPDYIEPPEPPPESNIIYGDDLVDSRDGQTYKTVVIGTQTWMAENLNYQTSDGSNCNSCSEFGRFYRFSAAQSACPDGWSLPSDFAWTRLTEYIGANAGKKLKSNYVWDGWDTYGFSALPAGSGSHECSVSAGYTIYYCEINNLWRYSFFRVGDAGEWWTSTMASGSHAYTRRVSSENDDVIRETENINLVESNGYRFYYHSVRCIKN
ncbi:MAG: hypothetical protein LBB36_03490 [Fibromonadaceae bacterium]|jgi:uncharacterized protein (TIGR02145 family)|nr:hypothetical protein [Fibromonadaceae bacterium]